jgi:hypothetical protein
MKVKAIRHMDWNGKTYRPGDVFEVSGTDAAELLGEDMVEVPDEDEETA